MAIMPQHLRDNTLRHHRLRGIQPLVNIVPEGEECWRLAIGTLRCRRERRLGE